MRYGLVALLAVLCSCGGDRESGHVDGDIDGGVDSGGGQRVCGNGVVEGSELCDRAATATCAEATGGGLSQGTVSCNDDCRFDVTGCFQCGNGTVEGPEQCDGTQLRGATCVNQGYDFGTVGCDSSCKLDFTGCTECGAGLVACGGTCVDTTTDPDHCGACNMACAANQTCTSSGCLVPALHSIHPEIVEVGQTIFLEGVFGSAATVSFANAAPVPAVILGPQRALVTVPDGALTGDVTVTTRGLTTNPVRVRVASFAVGLGLFRGTYEQAGYAQQTPSLTQARTGAIAVRLGRWLYVIGGSVGGTPVATIERALVHGDGSLGPFQAAGTLSSSRAFASAAQIGSRLFVVGGASGTPAVPTASIEQAIIAGDGTLGGFSPWSSSLTTARSGHSTKRIGRWLYAIGGSTVVERAPISQAGLGAFEPVTTALGAARTHAAVEVTGRRIVVIGGEANGALATIEHAEIDGDGDLGQFTAAAATLATPRTGAMSIVLHDTLYLLGGSDSVQDLATVERASIAPDGSLMAFASMPGLSSARRGGALQRVDNFVYAFGGSNTATLERASLVGAHILLPVGPQLETATGPWRGVFSAGDFLYHVTGSFSDPANGIQRAVLSPLGTPSGFAPLGVGLTPARQNPSLAIVGSRLYLMGGAVNTGGYSFPATASIGRASFDATGNLGSFTDAGTALTTARTGALTLVVGDKLYVIGGQNNGYSFRTIERFQIEPGGALTSLGAMANQLVRERRYPTGVVLGTKLYVIGGDFSWGNNSVEVADISGTNISTFTLAPIVLETPRMLAGAAVVGNKLYVFGGNGASTMEVATIGSDNTLGPFSTVANVSTTAGGGVLIQNGVIVGPPSRLVPIAPL